MIILTSWPWPTLTGYKGHRKVNIELIKNNDVDNIPVHEKFWNDSSIPESYQADKVVWPWANIKVQKGNAKANVKHVWDVENM